jgi:hypothetical protein
MATLIITLLISTAAPPEPLPYRSRRGPAEAARTAISQVARTASPAMARRTPSSSRRTAPARGGGSRAATTACAAAGADLCGARGEFAREPLADDIAGVAGRQNGERTATRSPLPGPPFCLDGTTTLSRQTTYFACAAPRARRSEDGRSEDGRSLDRPIRRWRDGDSLSDALIMYAIRPLSAFANHGGLHERSLADVATLSRGLADKKFQAL